MITWNDAYETEITNATYIFQLDNKIRELKQAIRERLELEHIYKIGDTDGQHISGKTRCLLYDTEANIAVYSAHKGAFAFSSDTKKLFFCTADGVNWY